MKSLISTLVIAFVVFFATNSTAQTISQLSATGGQMKAYTTARLIQPDSSIVSIRKVWSFNSSFTPSFPSTWDTVSTLVADTTLISDSIVFPNSGNFFVRWDLQVLDTLHTQVLRHSNSIRVTVRPVTIAPRIRLTSKVATVDGGVQSYWQHAGFDSATVKVFVSPGDTLFSNPVQIDQFIKVDSGFTNYTFVGWPSSYYFSYKLEIVNSKGDSTTTKGWMLTSASGQPWVGQVDSTSTDTTKFAVRVPVVTNGTSVVIRTYTALHNSGIPTDSITNSVAGQQGISEVSMQFINKLPGTAYDVWSCLISGGSGCASGVTITTLVAPVRFSLTTDSVRGNAVTGTVAVYGTAVIPSGETAYIYAEGSSTPTFAIVSLSSATTTYTQGIQNVVQYINNVQLNMNNFYRLNGFTAPSGDTAKGATKPFTLMMPTDTVKPVLVTFDTLYVTSTTAEIVFGATDNLGVTGFVITKNGTVVANLAASATGYIFSGLLADSTYIFGVQAKDAAGNFSILQTIVIHTPAVISYQQTTLTSVASVMCLDYSNVYETYDFYGTNFTSATKFNISYASDAALGNAPDTGTVTYISATHCSARIWTSYADTTTLTVQNPGTLSSNSLQTVLKACTTGVNEVDRNGTIILKTFDAYPNPFTSNITVSVKTSTTSQEKLHYTVTTLTGSTIGSGTITSENTELDLHQLPEGMYFVTISDGTHPQVTQKIVKQ